MLRVYEEIEAKDSQVQNQTPGNPALLNTLHLCGPHVLVGDGVRGAASSRRPAPPPLACRVLLFNASRHHVCCRHRRPDLLLRIWHLPDVPPRKCLKTDACM